MKSGCRGICKRNYMTIAIGNSCVQNYLLGFKRCMTCGDVTTHGIMILVPEETTHCPCCNLRLGTSPCSAKARRKFRELLKKQAAQKNLLMAKA